MAKRKYHNSSRSHCPNFFGGLLDLGEAFILDCYSAKYRERRRASGNPLRIDPYAAAGAAMGMGRLNSFDDIMRLGGILGSLGAFDPPVHRTPSSYDPPSRIRSGSVTPSRQTSVQPFHCGLRGNCYAWRLSCEDGSAYGLDPANYETRSEYDAALFQAKQR